MSFEAVSWCASIFFWALFSGVGVPPVPEEAGILYAASVAALHPEVTWWIAWAAVGTGIVAADLVLYGAGRLWGQKLLEHRWVNRLLKPDRRESIETSFHRHGMKFLLMARLLPPLRTGVFLIAGTIRYSLVRFLIADGVYAIVGVGLVFFGGTALLGVLHRAGNWLLMGLAAVGVVVGLYFYYRYLRRLEVRASEKAVAALAPLIPAENAPASGDHESVSGSHWPPSGHRSGNVGAASHGARWPK